ncbi:MAG: formate dehydrogenase subunit alpha [Actinobacteria bacterium]|nr:formate dehydrogenase subunit alpha [Actinomycetota bacterium]
MSDKKINSQTANKNAGKYVSSETVEIEINGNRYFAFPGETLLEVALRNNIFIPSLCYDPRLRPQGSCRLCFVEVEGRPEAVPSCITKVSQGMKVITDSDHINSLVRLNLEMIISDHPLDCMTCDSTGSCALQDLAYRYNIDGSRFSGAVHKKKVLDDNPFIYRDNEKCILCGRCVRMCDEVVGSNAIGYAGRGFESEIVPAFEQSLKDTDCVFCGNCISTCPVGALQPKPYRKKARIWQVRKVMTTCPYCGVGCQLELHVKDNMIVNVTSPAGENLNRGNLCVKGRFGLDFVQSEKRLTDPLAKDSSGKFKKVSWESAIGTTSGKLSEAIKKYGPDSVGILSSAKVTNEENFLMSKFARAVVGTNNIDHCARLCHASTITGLIPTFGSGAMTNSIGDIIYSKASIIIGSNTTEAHPVIGYELIRNVIKRGLKLIVIDPRDIPITKYAALHLKQKPGTDIAVLMGIMNIIYNEGLYDKKYIEEKTEDFDRLVAAIGPYTPEKVAEISGVDPEGLLRAARMFATARPASIFYSMGITQHTCGTNNVMTVANLSMLTGNIGMPGGGVNPLRGQNNVQGACDMGALPNVYSGYQYVEDDAVRKKFEKAWGRSLPLKKGLAVTEMIEKAISGELKALYIMGENPMLSDPDLLHVAEALKKLEFIAVQDIFFTETAEFADIILPSTSFAEKNGTFTNTERRVQKVNKALDPPGRAKPDWEIICSISKAMGYPMEYGSVSGIMDEIASLTPIYGGINYGRLENGSLQWPCTDCGHPGTDILHSKNFSRGKGRFMPSDHTPPAEQPDSDFPFILTTGRILYHFHTRTMTGNVDALNEIAPMALVHINSEDAASLGISGGDDVALKTRRGNITARAKVDLKIKKGVVFIPFHYADSPANRLTNPAMDPEAKIPEFKACAVNISKA